MERTPSKPPVIEPLKDTKNRPLWSVMISVYNSYHYLPHTISSILEQAPQEDVMQIEVIDDCSTDGDVERLVQEMGKGRVGYYRQENNVGSLRNYETCINRAKGIYVHLVHGDDYLKPGFYKEIEHLFTQYPDAGAAFTAYDLVRGDNTLMGPAAKEAVSPCIMDNWLYKVALENKLQFICMVVKRAVYEKLGSFSFAHCAEDWEMWVRIAKHYPTAYSPKSLANYRVHQQNNTSNSFINGRNLADTLLIIDQITSYLPENEQKKYSQKIKKTYAHYTLRMATGIWFKTFNKEAVSRLLEGILKVNDSIDIRLKIRAIRMLMILPERVLNRIWNVRRLVNNL